jgi:tetratricopeptide (TPR) repeat protein
VIVGRQKYIDLPIPELYDLGSDAGEERSRAAADPDRVQLMTNVLRTFDIAPPNRPGRETAGASAALRSLGYISGTAAAKERYTEADDPKRLVEVDRDLHAASELSQNGDRDDAIKLLQRVIERRADTADAYITLAHAFWESGQPGQAIATLERGLAAGAPDRDIRIRLGVYLAESHTDVPKAIALLEAMPPDDVEALNGLGVAYAGAERFRDAIATFRKVLALDPTNGLAHQNIGSMQLREALAAKSDGDRRDLLQAAETSVLQALEADPALPDAHTTLGVILSRTGRKGDAIESWKRAVALDPTQFNALYNLWFELASAGRRDEAVVYGRQFVATAPPALFAADIREIRQYLGGV